MRVLVAVAHPIEHRLDLVAPATRQTHRLAGRAMHLDDPARRRTGSLVEFVDVLGDEGVQLLPPLELDQRPMPGIGLDVGPEFARGSALPVGLPDLGVVDVVLDVRCLLRRRVLGPQPLRTAEVGNPGVGRNPGAGQHGDGLGLVDQSGGLIDRRLQFDLVHGPAPYPPVDAGVTLSSEGSGRRHKRPETAHPLTGTHEKD